MTRRSPELVRLSSFTNPLTGGRTLTCDYGDVSPLEPERDQRIPASMMPDTVVDPTRPGYGYTGRLTNPGRVILLAANTREQIERWQAEHHEPWPFGGVASSITNEVLTITARNGQWDWQLHPAQWPEQAHTRMGEYGWWIGLRTRSAL